MVLLRSHGLCERVDAVGEGLYAAIGEGLATRAREPMLRYGATAWAGLEIDRRAGAFAAALAALGLQPGDRLAFQLEKSAELVFLYLGCLRLGVVVLPLNTAYTAEEIAYFIGDGAPRLFVVDAGREASVPSGTPVISIAALSAAADRVVDIAPAVARAAGDPAAICYTSGTTGKPKGAMLTQANLVSNARALIDLWAIARADVLLHALPLFHVHGLFVALHTALITGARIDLLPRFDVSDVIASLPEATVFMGVPTHYTRLLDHPGFDAAVCARMRLFVSGSAPLLEETFTRFTTRTGHVILERYGMTETGMIASNRLNRPRRAGIVGWPLPQVAVRIIGEAGGTCAAGETGLVEVKGPNVFAGYWRAPEKTAEEFTEDGFFRTGDLGLFEPDGALRLVGRAKDLIISGGLNIYPKEIETVLDALAGISESAVIGVPHPDFGEAVVAVLTLAEGADPQAASEDRVVAACRSALAGFKLPKRVIQIDVLPRNAMGKVQKAALRARFLALFDRR